MANRYKKALKMIEEIIRITPYEDNAAYLECMCIIVEETFKKRNSKND